MNNQDIIDEPISVYNYKKGFKWWQMMRFYYNLIVGICGLTCAFLYVDLSATILIIGILFYGFMANVIYNLGFILEAGDQHYLKGIMALHKLRWVMFYSGTTFSVILSLVICLNQ